MCTFAPHRLRCAVFLFGLLGWLASLGMPAEPPLPVKPLSLTDGQREALVSAQRWKIVVHAPKESNLPLVSDWQPILERAGFQFLLYNMGEPDATLTFEVKSTRLTTDYAEAREVERREQAAARLPPLARSRSSHQFTRPMATGADLEIQVSVVLAGQPPIKLAPIKSLVPCPDTVVTENLRVPDPLPQAYAKCQDGLFARLLAVIHAGKGARQVMASLKAAATRSGAWRREGYRYVAASGDRAFAPLLAEELVARGTDSEDGADLAYALGELKDAGSVSLLAERVLTKDGLVWPPAVVALGKIGDPKGLPALRAALAGDTRMDQSKRNVVDALDMLRWQPETAREKVLYFFAKNQTDPIVQMGSEATPALVELLDAEDFDTVIAAAGVLGKTRDPAASRPLCGVLLASPSPLVRTAAAEALGKSKDIRALRVLAKVLVDDRDPRVVKASAAALGRLGDASAVSAGKQAVEKWPEYAVRKEIVQMLVDLGVPREEFSASDQKTFLTTEPIEDVLSLFGLGLPLQAPLQSLARSERWDQIKRSLETKPTEEVIEVLKMDEEPIRRAALEVLTARTKQDDLGHEYTAWRKWWDTEGKQSATSDDSRPP